MADIRTYEGWWDESLSTLETSERCLRHSSRPSWSGRRCSCSLPSERSPPLEIGVGEMSAIRGAVFSRSGQRAEPAQIAHALNARGVADSAGRQRGAPPRPPISSRELDRAARA
jgi:hypothetical protein